MQSSGLQGEISSTLDQLLVVNQSPMPKAVGKVGSNYQNIYSAGVMLQKGMLSPTHRTHNATNKQVHPLPSHAHSHFQSPSQLVTTLQSRNKLKNRSHTPGSHHRAPHSQHNHSSREVPSGNKSHPLLNERARERTNSIQQSPAPHTPFSSLSHPQTQTHEATSYSYTPTTKQSAKTPNSDGGSMRKAIPLTPRVTNVYTKPPAASMSAKGVVEYTNGHSKERDSIHVSKNKTPIHKTSVDRSDERSGSGRNMSGDNWKDNETIPHTPLFTGRAPHVTVEGGDSNTNALSPTSISVQATNEDKPKNEHFLSENGHHNNHRAEDRATHPQPHQQCHPNDVETYTQTRREPISLGVHSQAQTSTHTQHTSRHNGSTYGVSGFVNEEDYYSGDDSQDHAAVISLGVMEESTNVLGSRVHHDTDRQTHDPVGMGTGIKDVDEDVRVHTNTNIGVRINGRGDEDGDYDIDMRNGHGEGMSENVVQNKVERARSLPPNPKAVPENLHITSPQPRINLLGSSPNTRTAVPTSTHTVERSMHMSAYTFTDTTQQTTTPSTVLMHGTKQRNDRLVNDATVDGSMKGESSRNLSTRKTQRASTYNVHSVSDRHGNMGNSRVIVSAGSGAVCAAPQTGRENDGNTTIEYASPQPAVDANEQSAVTDITLNRPERKCKPAKPDVNLKSWIIRPYDLGVCLEGTTIPGNQYWHSTKIHKRLSSNRVQTKSGSTYVLHGRVNDQKMIDIGMSDILCNEFMSGFPPNWQELVVDWWNTCAAVDQSDEDEANITIHNSRRLPIPNESAPVSEVNDIPYDDEVLINGKTDNDEDSNEIEDDDGDSEYVAESKNDSCDHDSENESEISKDIRNPNTQKSVSKRVERRTHTLRTKDGDEDKNIEDNDNHDSKHELETSKYTTNTMSKSPKRVGKRLRRLADTLGVEDKDEDEDTNDNDYHGSEYGRQPSKHITNTMSKSPKPVGKRLRRLAHTIGDEDEQTTSEIREKVEEIQSTDDMKTKEKNREDVYEGVSQKTVKLPVKAQPHRETKPYNKKNQHNKNNQQTMQKERSSAVTGDTTTGNIDPTPNAGRRSGRVRIRPLSFWQGEKLKTQSFDPDETNVSATKIEVEKYGIGENRLLLESFYTTESGDNKRSRKSKKLNTTTKNKLSLDPMQEESPVRKASEKKSSKNSKRKSRVNTSPDKMDAGYSTKKAKSLFDTDDEDWTVEEIASLNNAVAKIPQGIDFFWSSVADMMGNSRTEDECYEKYSQLFDL
eukprot:CFRG2535T1